MAPWRLGGFFVLYLCFAEILLAGGLTGTYYQYNNFVGTTVTQADRVMDLQWSGKAPPAPGARADGFSVKWDGEIITDKPGHYEFAIQTDGPLVRLWIDGHLVIDGWKNRLKSEFTGAIDLAGGCKHGIRIDYNDSFGPSALTLFWTPPGATKAVVPERMLVPLPAPQRPTFKINFGTGPSQTIDGLSDLGEVFGARPGLKYGWDARTKCVRKAWENTPDLRYGTYVEMSNHRWEIELPCGMYRVRLVAGAPDSVDAVCNIDVEGRPAIRNKTMKFNHWLDATVRVVVNDGRLTISPAAGSTNPSLCFVEIAPDDDSTRLMTWIQIGFSSDDKADRCTPPVLKRGGWKALFKEAAQPELQAGSRRILLSNPFGCIPGEDMQLDQLLHAKEAGLDWIDRDFVATWKPVTQSGVEVIAYFGAANIDKDFTRLIDPATNNKAYFDRFFASIQPALDAGMSIALDGSVMMPDSGPFYEVICKLRAMNVPVYVEARPTLENSWARNFPVICVDAFWHTSDPTINGGAKPWAVPTSQLTGEIIRFIQSPPEGKNWNQRDWLAPSLRGILSEGHTAAISFDLFVKDGIDPYSLLIGTAPTTQPTK
ncbi:MAG TPA: PA14 domain-containing protein [Tepidisphaeraceae bacterium]|nr:PA14 domain-containing protein [Tepidisphaeraceae bacterium]